MCEEENMFHPRWSYIFINIIVITGFMFIFSGCAKRPAKTSVVEQPSDVRQEVVMEKRANVIEKASVVEEQIAGETKDESKESVKRNIELRTHYIVRLGDSLWWIAKYKDHYNDPYLWPLIYEENKKIIKSPNLIYPGQKMMIPREGYDLDAIKKTRKKAGAPKPYQPPKEANIPIK
jgi:LysM repeat protein